MLSSSKEKFTQHELRKDTKNFHMMTWQKSVNSETFHVRAGMYLDAREDKHEVNAVRKIKRTLSRRGTHMINKSANCGTNCLKCLCTKGKYKVLPENNETTLFPFLKKSNEDTPTLKLKPTGSTFNTC